MKSFVQYLNEIVTDAPKKAPEHEYASSTTPAEEHEPGYTDHAYRYKNNTAVHIRKTRHEKHGDHSVLSFQVGGREERTGESSPKDTAEILSNVVHGGSHHLKTEKPNYFSYDVKHSEKQSGKNPKARANIYRKIMDRLADKHGYELHNTKRNPHSTYSEVVYKKKK